MSANSVKLIWVHLALLVLLIFSFQMADVSKSAIWYFLSGVLAWPVLMSLKDLYHQLRADFDRK